MTPARAGTQQRLPPKSNQEPATGLLGHAWVAAGTISRMGYGIVVLRVSSRSFGLSSLAEVGQLLSLMSIVLVASTLGTTRGLTQRHAEDRMNPSKLAPVNLAAGAITASCSMLLALALLTWRSSVESVLFERPGASHALVTLALLVPIYGANAQITAIAAGQGQGPKAAQSSILASASGVGLVLLVANSSLNSLLIVVALQGAVNFFFHLVFFLRPSTLRDWGFHEDRNPERLGQFVGEARLLLLYAGAILLPVVLQQGTRILTRRSLLNNVGDRAAGLWEAVSKLQEGYVQVLGALLITMLLPELIRSTDRSISSSLKTKYVVVASISLLAGSILAVFGGEFALSVVYSSEAKSGGDLLALTLGADALRIVFYVSQIQLLAERRLAIFLVAEVVASGSLLTAALLGSASGSLDNVFRLYALQALCVALASRLLSHTLRSKGMHESQQ